MTVFKRLTVITSELQKDGKVRVFIPVGDQCPGVTTKTSGVPRVNEEIKFNQ